MIGSPAEIEAALAGLRASTLVHNKWYEQAYPDVVRTELSPAAHYLKYGAAMGRNPGRGFDTRFYLHTYADAAQSGLNPVLHYVRHGRDLGHLPRPHDQQRLEERRFHETRAKLLSLGFTDRPLFDLATMANDSPSFRVRAMAARELALWLVRHDPDEDAPRRALDWLAVARRMAPDIGLRRSLTTIELICLWRLKRPGAAHDLMRQATLAGEVRPDDYLATANVQPSAQQRLDWINRCLAWYGLAPVALCPTDGACAFDRLGPVRSSVPVDTELKVSVLVAAYDAASHLPTALRSLQQQTWANLEIIVIDDHSPDGGATCAAVERLAAEDPRIRLIRMDRNGGAYMARNRGLDAATGEFVTLHDADDWSHPQKIETQARFLRETPGAIGCTSEQVRATDDLTFPKLEGFGQLVAFNTSSFMFRRRPIRDTLGYWDTVRVSADNELIRRVRKVFGDEALRRLSTGPLSFQRIARNSATFDPVTGLSESYYGIRKEYLEAQLHHHSTAPALKYEGDPSQRPFPAPVLIRADRAERLTEPRLFDLVLFGDFRTCDAEVAACIDEIGRIRSRGGRVGLVEVPVYDRPALDAPMCPEMRRLVDGEAVEVLCYGDQAQARETRSIGGGDGRELRYLANVVNVD